MPRIEVDVRINNIFVFPEDISSRAKQVVENLRDKWLTLVFEDVEVVTTSEIEREAIATILREDEELRELLDSYGAKLDVTLYIDEFRVVCS